MCQRARKHLLPATQAKCIYVIHTIFVPRPMLFEGRRPRGEWEMRNRLMSYGVVAMAMLGVLCLFLVSKPAAQDKVTRVTAGPVRTADKDPASMPTPRLSDGHPDFTGFWAGG